MSSSNLVRLAYKKETTYGVTPSGVAASLVIQDITWTATQKGEEGNDLSVEYLDTVLAGAETVVVTGNKVTVNMEDGASSATQIMTAVTTAAAALAALGIGAAITGVGADLQLAAAEANLTLGAGSFLTARFISEKYSGTPATTESQQIRSDRQSSGQVVTGLAVDGGHGIELAKEQAIEDFLESAMFNAWEQFTAVNGNFSLDLTTKKLARVAGSFIDEGVEVGNFLVLSNWASAGNNAIIYVNDVTDLEVTFCHPSGMATAAAEAATYQKADKLAIGTTKKSLTVEKTFTDLTTKAIVYSGCLVSQMELNVEYGALISGSFDTQGNGYATADAASEFASYQHYFTDPATSNSLNGSVDMPFLATDVTGSWGQDAFCIQSLKLKLNNNLTVQNCIGQIAPENYSAGTAGVSVDLSSYLKDGNWDLLARKLSQSPFALAFMVQNDDGWYGFHLPAIQVTFDDPTSGGANQEISMEMSGMAKVGSNGESALAIYRAPT